MEKNEIEKAAEQTVAKPFGKTKPKESTEKKPVSNKPAQKSTPEKTKTSEEVESKPEKKKVVIENLPELWSAYQKGILNSAEKGFDIPLPGIQGKPEFDIVFKKEVIEELKKKMESDPVQKEPGKIVLVEIKQGINTKTIPFCEIRIKETEKGLALFVQQLRSEKLKGFDLGKDVEAIKLNGQEFPLVYSGKTRLQDGIGRIDTGNFEKDLVLGLVYKLSEKDKLAGLSAGKKGGIFFVTRAGKKVIKAKTRISKGEIVFKVKVSDLPRMKKYFLDSRKKTSRRAEKTC